jgi:hypothetical protein
MKKLIKPVALLAISLVIVGGAGYWWFSRAPLSSEFIAIIPDQAYIDWEADKLPTVDKNDDHIADALLVAAANPTDQLPVLISLTYDEQAKTAVRQLEKILVDQPVKFYPSASVMAATADLATVRQIARLDGVVMVEEDIAVAGLTRALAAYPIQLNSPIQTAGVALIDGGTSYATAHREALIEPAGAGLGHGNTVAANLLQIDPAAQIIDVAVLDEEVQAPVSRLIEGVDWTIANKDKYNIATVNVSAGYAGETNFAFNRALSAAAADGLAVVVSVANTATAGAVANKVPGMVRVGSYSADQTSPSANYGKSQVDVLAPATDAAGPSAAAAEMAGVVSKLIASSAGGKSTDWWTALSTTVINIDDVITLTDDQLNGIASGDSAAIDEFMRPLRGYLQSAIDQLQTELDGSADSQTLLDLLESALNLTDLSAYTTDIDLGGNPSDINDFWDELWGDLGE